MDTVTQLNMELASLSKVLLPLRCESVYHTAPYPVQTFPIPKDFPFQIDARGHGQYIVSTFVNPSNHQKYMMLVNRDYRGAHTAKMQVRHATLTAEYDHKSGRFIAAPAKNMIGDEVAIFLPAGDGRLFAYE